MSRQSRRIFYVLHPGEDMLNTGADLPVPTIVLDLQRERCLIFVACTRAREDLYVSWYGHPSPFLTPLL